VVRDVVFNISANDVEAIAARNEDSSREGRAVCNGSEGGMRGCDKK
jgi:hypothetical protein